MYLFQKYSTNTLTDTEYDQLKQWIDDSEEHKTQLENYIRLYKLQHMKKAFELDSNKALDHIFTRYHRKRRLTFIRYAAVAACLLLVLSSVAVLYTNTKKEEAFNYQKIESPVLFTTTDGKTESLPNGGELVSVNDTANAAIYHTVKTQRGGNFKLILPDQSIVWMNANTTVSYAANFLKDRTITLEGEAFFDVHKNGTTFKVNTTKSTVRVHGTRFNVSAYTDKPVLTTLVHGAVEVFNSADKQMLVPQKQAITTSSSSKIEIKDVNTDIYTSWITGIFDFRSARLSDLLAQLNEWYDLEIVYQSPQLKNELFTGTLFRDKSLAYSLQLIQEISDVKFRDENGKLYVYK